MTREHFLEGKDIVVAGAGVAGLAFALNLQRQWGDNVPPLRVVVYDRDKREVDLRRQGYSQTLSGIKEDTGLVVLKQLGLLDKVIDGAVMTDAISKFTIWDKDWNASPSFNVPAYGDMPTSAVRIPRRVLRTILIEAAEAAGIEVHWSVSCEDFEYLDDGRVGIRLRNADDGEIIETRACDLLVAADGANSKIRTILRPDDTLQYTGLMMMGGVAEFPHGAVPDHIRDKWGMVLTDQGISCFLSPTSQMGYHWGLSWWEQSPRAPPATWSIEYTQSLKSEALRRSRVIADPFATIVKRTDPSTMFIMAGMDKRPFSHEHLRKVVFIGDSNHAFSPLAGNGANVALKDGYDLAEQLCKASCMDDAISQFDRESVPRALRTLDRSHERIASAHTTQLDRDQFTDGSGANDFLVGQQHSDK
ncbi:FAD-dependent oxidoreductase [Aspergillus candidus]|uniref:Monooxygenase cfoF n=1 Tax=Aspergillus candidus TaxID=41067 RepID=CFOF_ASPCN|nr:putative monooxygenase [Aspergillus candidus]A0A2I2F2J4.1 RecName: Full=Monooxygenase cfoF; AltName: Full=Chlorflavonin biosynthesis cluster protein F [Aspergillus candidus]PLB34865.1 putative monooxygenase [Aspergillus candidus]